MLGLVSPRLFAPKMRIYSGVRKRAVYWSNNPVCSFAYALSHDGARKVLELTGAGQGEAFDVKMMGECKTGNLKCILVAPEVMHQYFPTENYGVKSLVDIGNGEVMSVRLLN